MPDYFSGYNTRVHFIDDEEFERNHKKISHGGKVIRQGTTSDGISAYINLSWLCFQSQFTASVNIAYARACYRIAQNKDYGAKTVLDIARDFCPCTVWKS